MFLKALKGMVAVLTPLSKYFYYAEWLQMTWELHKFIGNKVIALEKLNSRHCKEQIKMYFSLPTVVQ
jgi:hypothetical protein